MSDIFKNDKVKFEVSNGVLYLKFKNLLDYEHELIHCFTTRIGGVSTGGCLSLNLGFKREENRENVLENFRRISGALGINIEDMVLSDQVHDVKTRIVASEDRGKGIIRDTDIIGIDALATKEKNVALVTFYADCVPVYIFDPVTKSIASVHSGWRGTVNKISVNTVCELNRSFGVSTDNLIVSIGPSIGMCCFEVGDEVFLEFSQKVENISKFSKQVNGKWHIDMQGVIKDNLIQIGVKEENILVCGICTKCNSNIFFSHRAEGFDRGSLAAIMQLK